MSERQVRFTPTAQKHVKSEKQWWLENRVHTEICATEFEEALKVLTLVPGAGSPYPQAGIDGLCRLYLPKVACHLYYTFDAKEVIVRAFWGARRRHGPNLNP